MQIIKRLYTDILEIGFNENTHILEIGFNGNPHEF